MRNICVYTQSISQYLLYCYNILRTMYVPIAELNFIAKCYIYRYYECNISYFIRF